MSGETTETVSVEAPVSTPQTQDAAPAESSIQSSWSGELDHLDNEEWYKALPDDMRASFRGGYERKLKAYDQGYQAKFQSLATERQSLAAERQKLQEEYREREQAIQAMLYGDQDPTKEWQEKLAATQAEAKTWQEKAEAHEAQQRSAMAEALITDAETDMPDVFGDDKLFNRYLDLVLAGTPVVEAKTMVRALIDKGPDLSPTRAERALDVRDTPRSVHVSRMSSFEEAKKAFLES